MTCEMRGVATKSDRSEQSKHTKQFASCGPVEPHSSWLASVCAAPIALQLRPWDNLCHLIRQKTKSSDMPHAAPRGPSPVRRRAGAAMVPLPAHSRLPGRDTGTTVALKANAPAISGTDGAAPETKRLIELFTSALVSKATPPLAQRCGPACCHYLWAGLLAARPCALRTPEKAPLGCACERSLIPIACQERER